MFVLFYNKDLKGNPGYYVYVRATFITHCKIVLNRLTQFVSSVPIDCVPYFYFLEEMQITYRNNFN